MIKAILGAALLLATSAHADNCQRFWDFSKEVKPIPFATEERRVPSYVKTWRQLVAHSPRSIRKHYYYRSKRIEPRAMWGNFGWEKSLSTYREDYHKAYARLFALGGYPEHLGNGVDNAALLTEDIDQHYRFAREMRCLDRKGKKQLSFNESIKLED